jgi:Glycosyltransferase 61
LFVPLPLFPYLRLLRRMFSGRGSLESVAYKTEILWPEERATISPPIFLPGQLERVTESRNDVWFRTSSSEQIADATSINVTYPPTIAYHVKDAVLIDGSIYVMHFRYPFHPNNDRSVFVATPRVVEHVNIGALASTYLGTRFFGHWLSDDCTRYLLAEEAARVVCLRRSKYQHLQAYQTFFGQDWTSIDRATIDKLVVYQDFSQNSHKRRRYDILRGRIKSFFQVKECGSGVYLRRGNTGATRYVKNEHEIIDGLTNHGFVVVDVMSDKLEDLIGILLGAKIVISMEGSHIAHCIYSLPNNSALIVLQPPNRFSASHRSWSASLGIRFGFVVGSGSEAGYYFSVAEILRTAELALNQLESSTTQV